MRFLLVVLASTLGTYSSAQESFYVLDSSFSADSSIGTEIVAEWITRVEEATEGRVRIDFNGGQSPSESIEYLSGGKLDFAFFRDSADPGGLGYGHPMVQFLEFLSIGENDTSDLNIRLSRLLNPYIKFDYEFYRPLFLTFDSGNGLAFSSDLGITQLSDLQGVNSAPCIDSPLSYQVSRALGFNDVVPQVSLEESFGSGLIDLTICPFSRLWTDIISGPETRMEGEGGARFGSNIYVMAVSNAAWEKIGPTDQEAILSIVDAQWAAYMGQVWDGRDQQFLLEAIAEGGSHVLLDSFETMDFLGKTQVLAEEHARNYQCRQNLLPIYVPGRESDLYCFNPDDLKTSFLGGSTP